MSEDAVRSTFVEYRRAYKAWSIAAGAARMQLRESGTSAMSSAIDRLTAEHRAAQNVLAGACALAHIHRGDREALGALPGGAFLIDLAQTTGRALDQGLDSDMAEADTRFSEWIDELRNSPQPPPRPARSDSIRAVFGCAIELGNHLAERTADQWGDSFAQAGLDNDFAVTDETEVFADGGMRRTVSVSFPSVDDAETPCAVVTPDDTLWPGTRRWPWVRWQVLRRPVDSVDIGRSLSAHRSAAAAFKAAQRARRNIVDQPFRIDIVEWFGGQWVLRDTLPELADYAFTAEGYEIITDDIAFGDPDPYRALTGMPGQRTIGLIAPADGGWRALTVSPKDSGEFFAPPNAAIHSTREGAIAYLRTSTS